MRRLITVCCLAAFLCAGLVTTASAALKGGIGDQNSSTFSDPAFTALHVKRTRLITPYDSILKNPAAVDQWVKAALAAHLEPLIAFNPSQGTICPGRRCTVPSVASYSKAFKTWRKKYPKVKLFNFWNETNSATQPTGPTKAGVIKKTVKLYLAAKKICKRGCTVTGPDMLDQGIGDKRKSVRVRNQKRMLKWTSMFLRFAGRKNYPKIWGLHNYGDSNYGRSTGTAFFLSKVAKRGAVWVTETGGIFAFTQQSGQVVFPPNAARAAKGTKSAYTIAKKFKRRIARLYYYQWKKNFPGDRFDAGIEDISGALRPSYNVLKGLPSSFWR